ILPRPRAPGSLEGFQPARGPEERCRGPVPATAMPDRSSMDDNSGPPDRTVIRAGLRGESERLGEPGPNDLTAQTRWDGRTFTRSFGGTTGAPIVETVVSTRQVPQE